MSKAVLGQEMLEKVRPLGTELTPLDAGIPRGGARNRLGRTGEALQKLKEAARLEGFAEGRAAGLEEGRELGRIAYLDSARARAEAFASALDELLVRADGAMADWYARSEQALAELAVLIATRVIAQEVKTQPGIVLAMVKEALAEVTHAESARIRINPFDAPIVREHEAELLSACASVRRIEVVDDPALEGGCVIESDGGRVDASLETKILAVLESLREAA